MPDEPGDLLTTRQVADYLGVQVETVYAYVSRGVLTPARRRGPGGSRYRMADVEALLTAPSPPRRRRRPGTSDDIRTRITAVTDDGLYYRGHDVTGLARDWTFERVCELLWQQSPTSFTPTADDIRAMAAFRDAIPPGTRPLDRLKHALVHAASTDPARHDLSRQAVVDAGARATALMARCLPASPPEGSVAEVLAAHFGTDQVDDVRAALVLLADHDLAVATTALRVAVSVRCDPYSALLAALSAGDSPRHMSAPQNALAWLQPALRDPQAAIDAALAGEPPAGFGHAVYRERDPRAVALLDRLLPATPDADAFAELVEQLQRRRGWFPNIDVALALLCHAHGLPPYAGPVLFACARVAGWTAHALEELDEQPLRFRLRGIYTGPQLPQ